MKDFAISTARGGLLHVKRDDSRYDVYELRVRFDEHRAEYVYYCTVSSLCRKSERYQFDTLEEVYEFFRIAHRPWAMKALLSLF